MVKSLLSRGASSAHRISVDNSISPSASSLFLNVISSSEIVDILVPSNHIIEFYHSFSKPLYLQKGLRSRALQSAEDTLTTISAHLTDAAAFFNARLLDPGYFRS